MTSYPGCLVDACWTFHTFWQSCTGTPGGTVVLTQAIGQCLCASASLAAYDSCYPCLIQGLSNAVNPVAFSATCASSLPSTSSYTLYFPIITTTTPALPTNTGNPNAASGGSVDGNGGGGTGSSNHTAMFAGIGAGAAVLVLGVAIFFYMRNKNSKKGDNTSKTTKADNGPGPMPSMQLVHQAPQYSLTQPQQPPQPEQLLYAQPQQYVYAQQSVIPPQQRQDLDLAMQQQQFIPQYIAAPQEQQAMTFYQPPTTITPAKSITPMVTSAADPSVTMYIPPMPMPMPMPMPAQSTSYGAVSPTAKGSAIQASAIPSPTPVSATQGPQSLLISKNPQFVGGDELATANAPAPLPLKSPQYFENT